MRVTEKRRLCAWLLCIVMLISAIAAFPASVCAEGDEMHEPETNELPGWPQKDPIYGESCVLMDNESGAVLCSLNRDMKRYPASTTKVMTCLLTLENLPLDAMVTMTAEGTAGVADDSSNAGTVVGEEFTVEQCLYMLMLKSANDIANQLAVEVSGSIEAFAEKMTARAEAIGCTGTHFHNASGMPDEEHYTTAMDLALIFQEALKNDKFREIISTLTYTVPPTNKYDEPRNYTNHNSLINPDTEYYYEPCIGGKTGFTNAAQRTLVTAALKDGRTLICVTMRTPDKSDYYDQRKLYNYGFDNFVTTQVGKGNVVLPSSIDGSPLQALAAAHVSSGNGAAPAANSLFTASYNDLGNGLERVTYYYNSLPVGSAVEEVPQEEVVLGADSAAETPAAPAPQSQSSGGLLLMAILAVVVIAALSAAGLWYKRQLDRQRERLRQRRRFDRRKEGPGQRRQLDRQMERSGQRQQARRAGERNMSKSSKRNRS